jgi:uncharacterized Ntn-hydrolase superfamily protein
MSRTASSELNVMLSILACDPRTGEIGTAVAASSVAVGARCPYLSAGAALTTQGFTNPRLGPLALDLLRCDLAPDEIIHTLRQHDRWIEWRQIAIVSERGEIVVHTGENNVAWAGHLVGETLACLGNGLPDAKALQAMRSSFEKTSDKPFADRLLTALDEGRAVACGKCGVLSAAVLAGSSRKRSRIDLRVDMAHQSPEDGGDALRDLRRLYERYDNLAEFYERWSDNPSLGGWRDWEEKAAARKAKRIDNRSTT